MKRLPVFFTFIIAVYLMLLGCATIPKSPLIEAASKGDSITAQRLIKEGANVNEQDKRGDTPLMHAV